MARAGAADARVYVFRTGLSGGIAAFAVGALLCLVRRRRLVLAASNDWTSSSGGRSLAATERLYRLALRRTGGWSSRASSNSNSRVRRCPMPAGGADPELYRARPPAHQPKADVPFIWIGRIVGYKLPVRYVDCARTLPETRFEMVAFRTGETPATLEAQLAREAAALPNLGS